MQSGLQCDYKGSEGRGWRTEWGRLCGWLGYEINNTPSEQDNASVVLVQCLKEIWLIQKKSRCTILITATPQCVVVCFSSVLSQQ